MELIEEPVFRILLCSRPVPQSSESQSFGKHTIGPDMHRVVDHDVTFCTLFACSRRRVVRRTQAGSCSGLSRCSIPARKIRQALPPGEVPRDVRRGVFAAFTERVLWRRIGAELPLMLQLLVFTPKEHSPCVQQRVPHDDRRSMKVRCVTKRQEVEAPRILRACVEMC